MSHNHARLSVNINKVALLRNSRGSNIPNLVQFALDCEAFGAEGITVHPRPDQRHIRFDDIAPLKEVCTTEFNIEGKPTPEFMELVLRHKPHQCTLVPDADNQLTSDHGWDTLANLSFLKDTIARLQDAGIRTSVFIDPIKGMLEGAKEAGTDRIEYYTGPFAHDFYQDKEVAIKPFREAAQWCHELGLGINAGHDLNLDNLAFFNQNIHGLLEVSIGHALIKDALYYGIQNAIQMYKAKLNP